MRAYRLLDYKTSLNSKGIIYMTPFAFCSKILGQGAFFSCIE
jgi:hypothetical protein